MGGVRLYRAREVRLFDAHAIIHAYQKIEFPTLTHFIEDVLDMGIHTVRLDLFEDIQASELSFVHYVTLTLYVTAMDPSGYTVYEYTEGLGTGASAADTRVGRGAGGTDEAGGAGGEYRHPELVKGARDRLHEVEQVLTQAHLSVRHGRFGLPATYPDGGAM